MSVLPKAIYKFKAVSIKIPVAIFTEVEKTILKHVQKHKRSWRAKAALRKKNGDMRHENGQDYSDIIRAKTMQLKTTCFQYALW